MVYEIKFNGAKFRKVLHYVIYKCGDLPKVSRTLIYKILFYSDFNYFKKYKKPLTGEVYLKYPIGLVPRDFIAVLVV